MYFKFLRPGMLSITEQSMNEDDAVERYSRYSDILGRVGSTYSAVMVVPSSGW